MGAFKIFQKREQKKIWRNSIIAVFLLIVLMGFLYLYFLLAPFKAFFSDLPGLAGFFGRTRYLLVMQNNSERRPTGGFVSAYANASLLLGVPSLEIKNSYDIPSPKNEIEPPYPMNELFKDDVFYKGYVFRDANWSPDFKQSARELNSLYKTSTGTEEDFDIIIAFNISAIESFLDLYGPLVIKNIHITKENLFHTMQFMSKNIDLHSKDDLSTRKDVMKDVYKELIKKIISSPSKYDDFVLKIKDLLNKREFIVYAKDPNLQTKLETSSWAGRLEKGENDYVHVNVANLGGRKADRFIFPRYQYTVNSDEQGKLKARLELHYDYFGTQGLYSDFYQSYVRVYLPKGIINLETSGDNRSEFKKERELSSLSVGTLIHIWPGETQSLYFEYDLPEQVMADNYKLKVLPMLGNFSENWQVTLRSKNLDRHWQSQDFKVRDNLAFFHENLSEPISLSASLKDDDTPPVIIWQKFLNNDTVELLFSEKLEEKSISTKSFVLKDLNVANEQTSKPIIVSALQDDSYRLHLKLEDLDWQMEEHFSLEMNNISDLSGNMIEPNPKKITIVMR